jgi:glycosyltransferase involved in cell wall biosynthesis
MSMDIAYVVRRSFPGPGGIATAMRVTARTLARAHHLRVWAARIDDEPITRLNATLAAQVFTPFWMDDIEVRPIPMGLAAMLATTPMALMTVPGIRRWGYQALRKATAPPYVRAVGARLAAEWGTPDVVHCWGGEHTNWAAGHAATARKIPLVVTPFAHPGAWGDDAMNAAFYRTADRVLALVPSEAAVYAKLGVPHERVRVVGVPVTPLPTEGPDVRARHDIGDDPLVLFLGVKEPYKGYRTLLSAAEAVWRSAPKTRFAFVGPRTEASEIDFAGVRDPRIVEVGLVDEAEVAAWQRAASVFCLPSTSEIMPVSILEAWQACAPVVAARWWCAHDIVTHGRDGLVVEPDAGSVAAAIAELIADPARARAMGAAGRAKVQERFTPEAVARRHEEAYEEARA